MSYGAPAWMHACFQESIRTLRRQRTDECPLLLLGDCGSAFARHELAAADDNLRSIATSIHRLRHQTTAMQAHTIFEMRRRTEAAMLLASRPAEVAIKHS